MIRHTIALVVSFLAVAWCLTGDPVSAQQAAQWNYGFGTDGTATATYPGHVNVKELGTLNCIGTAAGQLVAGTGCNSGSADNLTVTPDGTTTAQALHAWTGNHCVTPQDFGAKGDGTTNDGPALQAWLNVIAGHDNVHDSQCGFIPKGRYRSSQNLRLQMPLNSTGPVISGAGSYNSLINFDTGFNFTMGSTSTAMFYAAFRDFAIAGSKAGPMLQISSSTTDAMNGMIMDNVVVNNNDPGPQNVGIFFPALYNSRITATANCAGKGLNKGQGIRLQSGTMNWFHTSTGNCEWGLLLYGDGVNATSGNVFDAVDSEVNTYQIGIHSPVVANNIFLGGIVSYLDASDYGIEAAEGHGNIFKQMEYGGAGNLFAASVGVIWESTKQDLTVTPPVPASGGTATNTNVQPEQVSALATPITTLSVGGVTICAGQNGCSFIVQPGENVTVTYSGTLTWHWKALQF